MNMWVWIVNSDMNMMLLEPQLPTCDLDCSLSADGPAPAPHLTLVFAQVFSDSHAQSQDRCVVSAIRLERGLFTHILIDQQRNGFWLDHWDCTAS